MIRHLVNESNTMLNMFEVKFNFDKLKVFKIMYGYKV